VAKRIKKNPIDANPGMLILSENEVGTLQPRKFRLQEQKKAAPVYYISGTSKGIYAKTGLYQEDDILTDNIAEAHMFKKLIDAERKKKALLKAYPNYSWSILYRAEA